MAIGGRRFSRDDVTEQVDRLVSSPILSHSESLCKLLRYLAEQAWDYPKSQVKEYQIATEVFGRPADFDPRLDSTVRVQTGRLRAKLGEYYAGPGSHDQWVIEIPKGSYSLSFSERLPEVPYLSAPVPVPSAPSQPTARVRNLLPVVWVLALTVLALAGALAFMFVRGAQKPPNAAMAADKPQVPPELARFWAGFVDGQDPAIVVFSNAAFIGRPETGMRYFDAARDSGDRILDHYTGVGEVASIHELDQVFFQLGHRLRVKRGRLLSFDDAKQNDLIFVGSPSENLSLRELPSLHDLAFKRLDEPHRRGDLAIINLRPRNGEPAQFLASPAAPLTEDYAVIALMPGMGSSHWALMLAGITTIGTQAAVEFVCRPNQLADLFRQLPAGDGKKMPLFEALVRVKVSSGVPVNTQLVLVRPRDK